MNSVEPIVKIHRFFKSALSAKPPNNDLVVQKTDEISHVSNIGTRQEMLSNCDYGCCREFDGHGDPTVSARCRAVIKLGIHEYGFSGLKAGLGIQLRASRVEEEDIVLVSLESIEHANDLIVVFIGPTVNVIVQLEFDAVAWNDHVEGHVHNVCCLASCCRELLRDLSPNRIWNG